MEFDLDLLQSDSCVNSSFKTIALSWIELVVFLRACARYLRVNHFADKRHFQCDIVLFEIGTELCCFICLCDTYLRETSQ